MACIDAWVTDEAGVVADAAVEDVRVHGEILRSHGWHRRSRRGQGRPCCLLRVLHTEDVRQPVHVFSPDPLRLIVLASRSRRLSRLAVVELEGARVEDPLVPPAGRLC